MAQLLIESQGSSERKRTFEQRPETGDRMSPMDMWKRELRLKIPEPGV